MTGREKYFICRNEECKTETNNPEDKLSGGKVTEYISSEKDPTFVCKHCENKYREENGIIFLVLENEEVIESKKDYADLNRQYETNRIHFTKLVLKNIKELDYNGRTFLFNKCRIDELIIEDVEIISPYYPIIFSECNIDKIRITNSKITKANHNTTKSLWSFFGIVFFQTEITQSFTTDNCETSIAISGCSVKCALDISKNSKVDLAMIHNQQKPELKVDADSKYPKSIEVHIDPNSENERNLENCSIGKLIFEKGSSIKGKLIFKDCLIESIHGEPYCFEQDLVFLNCTFKDELILKRLSFKKSLIFEICTFEANATFSEIKIEEDFYINYSAFMKGLLVSSVKCGGYIKCQINTIKHKTTFEDNVVSKDISIKFINSDCSIKLYRNEITGYLLLKQGNTKGILNIHMLYADVLEIDDFTIGGEVYLDQSVLKNKVMIKRMEASKAVQFSMTKVGVLFNLYRSSFKNGFTAKFMEARVNNFVNVAINGNNTFDSCTFDQQKMSRNLINGPLLWDKVRIHNSSFNNNFLLENFVMQYCKIEDSIEFEDNEFKRLHKLYDNTVLGSLKYRSDALEKEPGTHNSFYTNVLILHNKFNFVSMEDTRVLSTLNFDNNTVQGTLRFGKRELSQCDRHMEFPKAISMTENKIRNTLFYNLVFKSPVFMWYNNFDGDLTFWDVVHHNTLDFTGCFVGGSFLFHNTKANNNTGDLILDNVFNDKRISFTNYIPASFSFINATFNGFEIPLNWKMHWKKLINKYQKGTYEKYILKEDILKKGNIKDQTLNKEGNLCKKDKKAYKHDINRRLKDQYSVLRHIYRSNGELKEEDSAYYMWMHYKNIDDMQNAPLRLKPKYWMKLFLYEWVFGWGVDLQRILLSTGILVTIFAAIYFFMFRLNPGLAIWWDNKPLEGVDIGPLKSLVFSLQTTFSAVLGDWAPIGAGFIKIPMTINAVLGVLFVTFLIGAYGRKMLR